MHTFNGKEGTTIFYDSDMSGDLVIVDKEKRQVQVPSADISEFYGQKLAEGIRELTEFSIKKLSDWMEKNGL